MSLDFWRNVSVIWISIHVFILCLIPAAVAYFAVRGMNWLLSKTGEGFAKAQDVSRQVNQRSEAFSARAAAPIIAAHSKAAGVKRTVESIFRQASPGLTTKQ